MSSRDEISSIEGFDEGTAEEIQARAQRLPRGDRAVSRRGAPQARRRGRGQGGAGRDDGDAGVVRQGRREDRRGSRRLRHRRPRRLDRRARTARPPAMPASSPSTRCQRAEAEEIIMAARVAAGWIEEADLVGEARGRRRGGRAGGRVGPARTGNGGGAQRGRRGDGADVHRHARPSSAGRCAAALRRRARRHGGAGPEARPAGTWRLGRRPPRALVAEAERKRLFARALAGAGDGRAGPRGPGRRAARALGAAGPVVHPQGWGTW